MMQSIRSSNDKKFYPNYKNSSKNDVETVSIFLHKSKARKRKKYKVYTCSHNATSKHRQKQAAGRSSLPELCRKKSNIRVSKSYIHMNNSYNKTHSTYFVDIALESSLSRVNYSQNTLIQTKFTVYRCQLSTKEESCCCSCNSDAMFEVMKSLYDCYKKKNCDHCQCILCGHLPRDERDQAKMRKTLADIGVSVPNEAEQKEKSKKALSKMIGKSPVEKEKILRDLALANIALPEPRTASEKNLMQKVRRDLGLPPEPDMPADKSKLRKAEQLGIGVIPLEGKTLEQKEKILRAQAEKGLPLPVGRTPSEKALIDKIRASLGEPLRKIASEKFRQAKTPEEKEKVLRELANQGIPFPEGKSTSENQLMDKIRTELGLPPGPKTASLREKYNKAANDGIFLPLEGKTPAQKEQLLQDLADKGIPLPEGRTPSEKALIAKIKARPTKKSPSEKFRRAKAAGLITPLQGKTPEEKEKILRGLAGMGIPFPEGNTPSEKKIIAKVRADLGLPPEPKTPSMREKYNKAINDGLIWPLEGKTPVEKEKMLQDLQDRGLHLPEGRTPSEKAIIAKVKARPRKRGPPSEKLRKAKAGGFLTPLEGKSPEQKEKILKGLAKIGLPLPEGKTSSEKKLINKVRAELGLPPEPKTPSLREKYDKAANEGMMIPLEGKTPAEKERILQDLQDRGIPLPEGRTTSEKAIIAKVKARPRKLGPPSEKLRKAKAAGFLTPLEGKTPEQKEIILKGLANIGLPLPEGKTSSEKKLINKVRAELGLPPEPKTPSLREKYNDAANEGVLLPLEGKTPAEKEKILQDLVKRGIPLPEGRTPSEKALISKVKTKPKMFTPSEKIRRAKAAGLITPLSGKTPEQKENILRGLADIGIPLPEGKTPSENKLIAKVRADLGLPPEPKSPFMREKYNKAANDGLLLPLEGKTRAEKEKILQGLADRGIPLPEGRSSSEKSLIAKVLALAKPLSLSEKVRKAKEAGLITPIRGKSPEDKEKILKGLANLGLPLPEGKSKSEKDILLKVRTDLGLPPEPATPEMRDKYNKAANDGIMLPLEGKTPEQKEKILTDLAARGIPLPVGRTSSEKSLIAKVHAKMKSLSIKARPSERLRKAKAAGLLTPLSGKTPEQKENILKGLALHGLPLPEGNTPSEKKIIDKVRAELGLPPEPKTPSLREKYKKAGEAGLMVPLEGKTPAEKEKILQNLADRGIPLPVGRTPSEKAIIAKVKSRARPPSEGRRSRRDLGPPALPYQERRQLDDKTAKVMKEGKGPSDECICSLLTPESERERILKALAPGSILAGKLREAKAAGLLTPLEGKTPEQKEKILRALAKQGLPLPESKTPSDKKLIDRIRADFGLPPEPKTAAQKYNYAKAQAAGIITPLEGKTPAQKEKTLKGLAAMGVPLPQGRSPSEKALIAAVKKGLPTPKGEPPGITTEKIRKAKAAGLLTPLEGKTPEQKEKVLRGLAKAGFPLPEGKTPSDKALIHKIKSEFKIPEDTVAEKMRKARAAGLITPLTGKTPAQKEKILRGLAAAGLPFPEGKTPSDKALIKKIKADTGYVTPTPSERMRKAQAAGLLTPLAGKTPAEKQKALRAMLAAGIPLPEGTPSEKEIMKKLAEGKTLSEKVKNARAAGFLTPLQGKLPEQKEKILKGLAKAGLPFPELKTASERAIANTVREELGLPPEPKSPSLKEKYKKAQAAGIITPLEGKTPTQKENILRKMQEAGIPLPEGRTPSEKAMVGKLKAKKKLTPSQKLKEAKALGLLTPLQGKTPAQKERILKGLAKAGLPLPEGKTPSEKELINKVRNDLGLPLEAKSPSMRDKMRKALEAGIITPLEGKTPGQKAKILSDMVEAGIPLPIGRTQSEKALIKKLQAPKRPSKVTSEMLRKAKAAGLLTPLDGKKPSEKEKIVRGLADLGMPLPRGKTSSERSLINKIRTEKGLPPPAETPSEKEIVRKAKADGLLTPIAGKSPKEKERILRGLAKAGLPLPLGITPSEKALVKKIRGEAGLPLEPTPSEKRGRIKTKAKKVGVGSMKMQRGAIGEEFQDIIKTTKCDRGCGCDKKKIRFKHSYVKIRVTSPDFSSICECPNECFPGIKGGIITDNEGIKVTVGSAVGMPSYFKELTYGIFNPEIMTISDSETNTVSGVQFTSLPSIKKVSLNIDIEKKPNIIDELIKPVSCETCFRKKTTEYAFDHVTSSCNSNESLLYNSYDTGSDKTFAEYYDVVLPASFKDSAENTESFDSLEFANTPTSITFISSDCCLSNIFTESDVSSIKIGYTSKFSESESNFADDSITYSVHPKSKIVNDSKLHQEFVHKRKSKDLVDLLELTRDKRKLNNVNRNQNEFLIFRVTQNKFDYEDTDDLSMNNESVVIISNFNNDPNIVEMVDEMLAKRNLSDASLFLVVPSSDDNSFESSSGFSSTICIQDFVTENTSVSALSVKKHKPVGSYPKGEYFEQFYYAHQDIKHADSGIPKVNGSKDLPASNKEKIINDELQKGKVISVTNTVKVPDFLENSSIHKSNKQKNILKHIRRRRAKKPDNDSLSTSASSVNRQPKKYSAKPRKKVSHGSRGNNQYKNKHVNETNNKKPNVKTHEEFPLKTLYKSEKKRSHKRCQVITKAKGDRKHPVKTTENDKEIKTYAGQPVGSRVLCLIDQCDERTERNSYTELHTSFLKNSKL